MYLSKIEIKNFRNFKELSVEFNNGLTVILGENNVGKTNVLDAIRLVLNTSGPRDIWPTDDDLYHDDTGNRLSNSFEIHITFRDLQDEELAWFSECLSPQIGDRSAQLHLRYEVVETRSGQLRRKSIIWGGETPGSHVDSETISSIKTTFLSALRDAEADLMPGRKTRIYRLLDHLSNSAEQEELVSKISSANSEIRNLPLVQRATTAINNNLQNISGTVLGQQASLAISDPTFQRIADSIRAQIGTSTPFEIEENGLGYNNLLYIATVLGEMQGTADVDLRLLLIEEPEAHLHPQLQTLLADHLSATSSPAVQTIITSHSPTLATHIQVDKLAILHRTSADNKIIKSTRVITCGLTQPEINGLTRYLDATKANLFFARGVILVEGISETLLIPILANDIHLNGQPVSLSQFGVSVVNIDGLAFAPFAQLFREGNIEVPCSLITDGDPHLTEVEYESIKNGTLSPDEVSNIEFPPSGIGARKSPTAESLIGLESGKLGVFTSAKTFEYDLVLADNLNIMMETFVHMHPVKGANLMRQLESIPSSRDKAKFFFENFDSKEKGRFAQLLALKASSNGTGLRTPPYIRNAILHAIGQPELLEQTNEPQGTTRAISVAG